MKKVILYFLATIFVSFITTYVTINIQKSNGKSINENNIQGLWKMSRGNYIFYFEDTILTVSSEEMTRIYNYYTDHDWLMYKEINEETYSTTHYEIIDDKIYLEYFAVGGSNYGEKSK